jgi:hypothetical protein
METRRPTPWGWILGTLALVLTAGAVGYWLGAHRGALIGRHFFFGAPTLGFGLVGLLALALIVALVVGVVVSALTRDATTTAMTYEEWHRRAHAAESEPDEAAPAAVPEPAPSPPPSPDAT